MNQTDMFNFSSINTTYVKDLKHRTYDHEGAMKFTVCVVLVYGIGVIGILSMYTHRKRKHIVEQETNAFMKTYANCREAMERKKQVSTAQNIIKTISDEQWTSSRRASQVSTASARPLIIRPEKLTLRTDPSTFHKLGNRAHDFRSSSLNSTPDCDELSSFICRRQGSFKHKGSFRRTGSLRSERDRCILETPETEDAADHVDGTAFRFTVTNVDDDDDGGGDDISNVNTFLNTPNSSSELEHSNSSIETQPGSHKEICSASTKSFPSNGVKHV